MKICAVISIWATKKLFPSLFLTLHVLLPKRSWTWKSAFNLFFLSWPPFQTTWHCLCKDTCWWTFLKWQFIIVSQNSLCCFTWAFYRNFIRSESRNCLELENRRTTCLKKSKLLRGLLTVYFRSWYDFFQKYSI